MNQLQPLRFSMILIGLFSVLLLSCNQKPKSNAQPKNNQKSGTTVSVQDTLIAGKWEPFPLGDIDNDELSDTAFVYTPAYRGEKNPEQKGIIDFNNCLTDCYNKVRFSNKLPEISIPNSLWGSIETTEDLDGDGLKELIFQTNWWIGSHVDILIYSLNKHTNQWTVLAKNNVYFEDSYKERIQKISNKTFRFKVEYLDTLEQDIRKKDIIITIKK